MAECPPVFLEYARSMISFLVEVRGIALKDLEPEIVADAMIRGAAAESVVWRERERCWNDSYHAAAHALDALKQG